MYLTSCNILFDKYCIIYFCNVKETRLIYYLFIRVNTSAQMYIGHSWIFSHMQYFSCARNSTYLSCVLIVYFNTKYTVYTAGQRISVQEIEDRITNCLLLAVHNSRFSIYSSACWCAEYNEHSSVKKSGPIRLHSEQLRLG